MFVKLFLWFWLALTLSALISFLLAFNMRLGPLHAQYAKRFSDERTRIERQALALYGRGAASIIERYGKEAAKDFAGRRGPPGMYAYLFEKDGTPISGDVPANLRYSVLKLAASGGDEILTDKGMVVMALRIVSPRGKIYIAAAEATPSPPLPAPPPIPQRRSPFPSDFWFRFSISFVIGGLVCYGLSWHLTSPVRRLRAAAQRLGTGDLSTRVTITSKGRGDEVTDLVRDFNRMAERIEKLMTAQKQLVRDVSHELRSPLARLNVALGIARREATPAATLALDRIEQEAERLNWMIGEMLTLSLLESGGERFEQERFDLDEMADEVVGDADFEAAGSDRHVQYKSNGPLMLSGNREMLRRALENVVRNAIRYTDHGTAVEVSLEREGAEHVVIRVRDHGPGLPEEALTEIFRPFYRSAEARDRQSGGAGIGLAITERAVRLHSGEVKAANAADGGLMITMRLPLATGE
jgi:two-component system sensor histidine kinase CpxA